MGALFFIILSTFLVSTIALIGSVFLLLRRNLFERIVLFLVALSAGALMGGAFLHLIPESIEKSGSFVFLYVLFGFALFFFIEKVLDWHHCNLKKKPKIRSFAYVSLVGEATHNFIDGLIIAASFVTSIPLGIATTLAVALHEIPQEIGDFGILVYGGYKKTKALIINFIIALTAIFGGLSGFYLSELTTKTISLLLPIAAGGFIYVAASDLIPEIRKQNSLSRFLFIFLTFVAVSYTHLTLPTIYSV